MGCHGIVHVWLSVRGIFGLLVVWLFATLVLNVWGEDDQTKRNDKEGTGHIVTKLLRHRCGRSNLDFYDFWIHPPMSLLIRIASHCRGPSSLDRRTLEIATSILWPRLEIFSKFTEISSFSTNKIAILGYTMVYHGKPHFQTHPSIMLLVRYLSHDLPLCSHKMVAVLHPHFG